MGNFSKTSQRILKVMSLFAFTALLGGCVVGNAVESKWTFLDRNGNATSKNSFPSLSSDDDPMLYESYTAAFHEKLCRVKVDHQYGFVDSTGQYAIKPQFNSAGHFSEGLACVADEANKLGYIDPSGAYVIPPKLGHDDSFPSKMDRLEFHDGLAAARYGGKYGFIDHKGNFVIKHIYDTCLPFSGGVAEVIKDKSDKRNSMAVDCIDKTGKLLCTLNVDQNYIRRGPLKSAFSENGLALCLKPTGSDGRLSVFCDKKGKETLGPFSRAEPFSEGLAAVVDKSDVPRLYEYIDVHGEAVIAAKFYTAAQFHGGLACVSLPPSGKAAVKFGFIDKTGKFVIEPSFDRANDFSNGLALVWQADKCGYIDKTGKVAIPFKYGDGRAFSDDVATVDEGMNLAFNMVAMKPLPDYPQSFSVNKYPNAVVETAIKADINLLQAQKQTNLMLLSEDSLDNIDKFYANEFKVLGYKPRTMEDLQKQNIKLNFSSSGVKDPFGKQNYRFMAGENDREYIVMSAMKDDSAVTIYLDAFAK